MIHHFFTIGIIFSFIGITALFIAQKYHFFRLKNLPLSNIHLRYPIWGFIGYLIIFFLAPPVGIRFMEGVFKDIIKYSPAISLTLFQILFLCFTIFYLIFYSFLQDKETRKNIWIHPKRRNFKCIIQDLILGILTWFLAFPAIVVISQFIELIIYLFTGIIGVEQIAIQYLKMVSTSPFLLIIAIFIITIVAPFIEEFVFRGLLFTYLKIKWGFKKALILSSFLFSLFHFSSSQGITNITLLASLFFLSICLGFLYEKQGSLIAPIGLHMTFNSISVMRILLFSI